jgi:hypothetical protein
LKLLANPADSRAQSMEVLPTMSNIAVPDVWSLRDSWTDDTDECSICSSQRGCTRAQVVHADRPGRVGTPSGGEPIAAVVRVILVQACPRASVGELAVELATEAGVEIVPWTAAATPPAAG